MNKKEVSELRRRFNPEKTAISNIYGCYVNGNKEVIAYLDESLGIMPQEEAEQYLALLKKALSGKLNRNLIDIIFTTEQVMDSDTHRLLMALREGKSEARKQFFQTVIDSLDMGDSNYLILCANDAYDVPFKSAGDIDRSSLKYAAGEADQVYRYFICAVCPVKDGKKELGFFSGENEFHNSLAKQVVSAPELGFLFPAFDDRASNIYNALFYARKPDEIHHEFIDAIFQVEPPMSAAEQREAFERALSSSLACRMEVIRAVHEQLKAKIDEHKETKEEAPLSVSVGDITAILTDCNVAEEQIKTFQKNYKESFGQGVLNPENIIDSRKFEVRTGEITITADPELSYLVETREIDGQKYIMVPVSGETELNGFAVEV